MNYFTRKTLTVIALVVTNHHDKRPLFKPNYGFIRQGLGLKMKGKAGGKVVPKTAKQLGVGTKLKSQASKKSVSIFAKFKKQKRTASSESESEEEKGKKSFKFGRRKSVRKRRDWDSPDPSSSESEDLSDSEDYNKVVSSSPEAKSGPRKRKVIDSSDDDDQSQKPEVSIVLEEVPEVIEDSSPPPLNPGLNLDGQYDDEDDSSDEENLPGRKRKAENFYEDVSFVFGLREEQREGAAWSSSSQKQPLKKSRRDSGLMEDSDLDGDLQPAASGSAEAGQSGVQRSCQLIIPDKRPAERRGRRRPTLIVCPTSLISHWVSQLDSHIHQAVDIQVKIHHGSSKAVAGADLENFDVVITTYGTMAGEFGAHVPGPLLRARWLRVVLDEGHYIKNHNSKAAKAAYELNTERKWIVTGTPIQNNLKELWALIHWLDFGVYAGRENFRHYKNAIMGPCMNGSDQGFERLQILIDATTLRRTKLDKKPDGSPIVELPSKTVVTREVDLDEVERLIYRAHESTAQSVVQRYHRAGKLLSNYAHIFVMMLRLRQLCCHRELIQETDWPTVLADLDKLRDMVGEVLEIGKDGADRAKPGEEEKKLIKQLRDLIREGVSEDCSICLDDLKTPVITPCGHVFCKACIEQVLDNNIQTKTASVCPLCRNALEKKDLLEAGQVEDEEEGGESGGDDAGEAQDVLEDVEVEGSSSKINAAIKEMLRIRQENPGDKIVVVSQFTSFLSIIQPLIRDQGFSYVRLDG